MTDQIVKHYSRDDVFWNFDGGDPYYNIQHGGAYAHQVKVRPTTCYSHDLDAVEVELARLQTLAPVPHPLLVATLSHEFLGGTNGFYYDCYAYDDRHLFTHRVGYIVLCAKVIPIHPAMTRYLVAHEYGHGIDHFIERGRGMTGGALRREYVEKCRPDTNYDYGPGKWHSNVGELIANDFRILVAGREPEFWPHPGFARPEDVPAVVEFWKQAQDDLLNGKLTEARDAQSD